ncbi:hypothetical protein TEH_08910 [Tetragenococcus halophilus NBRC 12172]|uniref:Abi family protein n=2 Tax=Tetragenococcus halophilus TaxID=51669 RepID=A0AAN1VQP7_TETHN|nr:Abi family protein [Tetragenococcus halophilus]BAK94218.1 hypothetical protein TEH_08910 [Tetragenococcus halophilus NBRC 12172]
MKIEGENKQKLAQLGKNIEKDTSTVKDKKTEETENANLKRILDLVSRNGKLSVDDQISYMKYKGITFNYISENEAKKYLSQNTYYYKVTSFRKNISKKEGKYVSLDFGLLNDLATIDMYLRYILIKINLDIEHSLKALLINSITDSKSEDGYKIVREYDNYCKLRLQKNSKFDMSSYIPVNEKIMSRNKDLKSYNHDMYLKRKQDPPIWVLIELMSFGELIRFIEFYYENNKSNSSIFNEAYKLLKYTKNFRDSAAHSRPLLLDIVLKKQISPTQEATEYAKESGIEKLDRKQRISNKKVHDLICMLIIHDKYIQSDNMKQDRKEELNDLTERCVKRSYCYKGQDELKKVYEMFCKVVANYYK